MQTWPSGNKGVRSWLGFQVEIAEASSKCERLAMIGHD